MKYLIPGFLLLLTLPSVLSECETGEHTPRERVRPGGVRADTLLMVNDSTVCYDGKHVVLDEWHRRDPQPIIDKPK